MIRWGAATLKRWAIKKVRCLIVLFFKIKHFSPQTLFDIGSFSGSCRSYRNQKLSDWSTKRRQIEKFLKQKLLKIVDSKVSRHFQASQSTFRGVLSHRKIDQNFEIILSPGRQTRYDQV